MNRPNFQEKQPGGLESDGRIRAATDRLDLRQRVERVVGVSCLAILAVSSCTALELEPATVGAQTIAQIQTVEAPQELAPTTQEPAPPSREKPLLDLIARVEAGGNYNAYFANVNNTEIQFTSMTVGAVLIWQQTATRSPVGAYQIKNSTLVGLIEKLDISHEEIFNAELQEALAVELLKQRGLDEFLAGRLPIEQFAHSISKEWAALPVVLGPQPHQSNYAADGLNKAQVGVEETLSTIEGIR
ncbi:hypothetical protein BH23PAT1_BH23PAT1_3100 [soil metagenome]